LNSDAAAFDDPSEEHLDEPTSPLRGAEPAMIGRGKAVLVVDPDDPIRQMLAGALRLLKFERVLLAETVAEARAALTAGTVVDLALIDWDGEPSGFDLAADLRTGRVSRQHDLPIVMLAGRPNPAAPLRCRG
jgi:DNA-binding response OmpR family regulator